MAVGGGGCGCGDRGGGGWGERSMKQKKVLGMYTHNMYKTYMLTRTYPGRRGAGGRRRRTRRRP